MKFSKIWFCFLCITLFCFLSFIRVSAINESEFSMETADVNSEMIKNELVFESMSETAILGKIIYSPKSINIPILLYHHLSENEGNAEVIKVNIFESHIKALRENGYNTITITEMLNYVMGIGGIPQNPVCITFDDGYLSNFTMALPILEKYDSKATIFVVGHSVGKDTYKETEYNITAHFNWEEAQIMIDTGLIDVQSHSWDMHQWPPFEENNLFIRENMKKLSDESLSEYLTYLINDCNKMNEEFYENLGYVPIAVAYPRGKYDSLLEDQLLSQGIKVTLDTEMGNNKVIKGDLDSLIGLNRTNIDDYVSVEDLLQMVG